MVKTNKKQILSVLKGVMDPEIPVLSLVDLGVIGEVQIHDDSIELDLKPTFSGCPALDQMKLDIEAALYEEGIENVKININYKEAWSSADITEEGRRALKNYGIAPPGESGLIDEIEVLEQVECPQCGSSDTKLMNPFGPTLCRSVHYCNNCLEAFQSFKPLG